jgi:hypothetical protein
VDADDRGLRGHRVETGTHRVAAAVPSRDTTFAFDVVGWHHEHDTVAHGLGHVT